MANKIVEIMESGHLRKLEQFGEAVPVLEMFTNIWGVGAKTAQLWYQQVRKAEWRISGSAVFSDCKRPWQIEEGDIITNKVVLFSYMS